ncbi:MAG: tetratricopeptide repeat protein, partial [Acidobacteriota bacterium]
RPLVGLAKLAARQQRVDEAVERYREAIEVAIASQAPPPFVLRPTLDLATLMVEADRCDEGESTLRDSLEHSRAHADRFWRYAAIESLLGDCLARQPSRREEARSLLERSYERLAQQPDIDRETLRRVLQRLESFYASLGDDPARPREIISLQSLGP